MLTYEGMIAMKTPPKREIRKSLSVRAVVAVSMLALVLGPVGCKKKKKSAKEDEDIKLAVQEDSKLQSSQEDLLRRRGSLVRQRDKLAAERSALEEKKKALAKGDTAGAAAIRAEEQKLNKKEKDLSKQEDEIDSRLGKLLKQRNALLAKATAAISSGGGGGPEAKVARREQSIARRESALAKREADLAKREAALARREREVAKGCAAMGGPVYTVTKIQVPGGKGAKRYGKSDVQSVYSKALHLMSSRGIRTSDLPSGVARLKKDISGYIKKKQFYRGKYAADQFYKIIKSIRVDRGFVGAKMARLHRYIRRKKLSADKEKKVNNLFRQATSAYSDGRFRKANARLNRIYSVAR